MKASELSFQGLECLQTADVDISGGYTSDLLSDVMANLKEGDVLITIQAHKNTVAVASLTGASAVIFCHNRKVEQDVLDAASREGIAVFVSTMSQFDTTCALATALGI